MHIYVYARNAYTRKLKKNYEGLFYCNLSIKTSLIRL